MPSSPSLRSLAAASLAALGLLGCEGFGQGGHGDVPGEWLGRYAVVAKIEQSSCGPGALGATDVWEFEMELSRGDRELFWLHAEQVVAGRLASDGVGFTFESRSQVPVVEPGPGRSGCTIVRSDHADGTLEASGETISGFEGRLRYGYVPASGSDCSPVLLVGGGFAALPCEIAYRMEGVRTAKER